MMKNVLSFAVALAMTLALAAPAFASGAPMSDPAGVTDAGEAGIMPLVALFDDDASSRNGGWTSSEFTATSSNGNYIRYWHNNETDHSVKVYLYRTDSGSDKLVSSMTVDANGQKSQVYYSYNAGSGTYKIVIESTQVTISGEVSAAQYRSRP